MVPTSRIKAPPKVIEEFNKLKNVEILLRHRVLEIVGDKTVKALKLRDLNEKKEKTLEVNGVFIFLGGTKPSVDFLMGQVDMTEGDCIVVNEEMMTSVPGVFAAGDVLCNEVKQAVVAAAMGVKAALAVDKYLNKKSKITPQW